MELKGFEELLKLAAVVTNKLEAANCVSPNASEVLKLLAGLTVLLTVPLKKSTYDVEVVLNIDGVMFLKLAVLDVLVMVLATVVMRTLVTNLVVKALSVLDVGLCTDNGGDDVLKVVLMVSVEAMWLVLLGASVEAVIKVVLMLTIWLMVLLEMV